MGSDAAELKKKRIKRSQSVNIDHYVNVTDPADKVNMLFRNLYCEEGKNKVETCFLCICLGKNSL